MISASDAGFQARLVPIVNLYERCSLRLEETKKQFRDRTSNLIIDLAQGTGAAAALEAMAAMQIDTDVGKTISAANKFIKIKPAAGKTGIPTKYCPLSEYIKQAQLPAKAAAARTEWKLDLKTVEQDTAAASDHTSTAAMCCAAGASCGEGSSDAAQLAVKGGKLFKSATSATDKTVGRPAGKTSKHWATATKQMAEQIAHADADIATALAQTGVSDTNCNPWQSHSDAELQLDVYRLIYKKPTATKIPTAEATSIGQKVKEMYGSTEAEFDNSIWNSVKSIQVPKKEDPSGGKTQELKDVTDRNRLNDLIQTSRSRTSVEEVQKVEDAKSTMRKKKLEAQKECEKNGTKTAAECTKLGCDHDAENNVCKPKTGSENTQ
ncbi:uncharacterized protein TEOVI_000123700 [Trypanosoma equiperdum]|uniref:Variant surface glycoprotein 1125 n=1 Tax=Trypanosoma equiperdum TaxID=5694 RepID=A0A1G4IC13_TRYEQ|nr:hypothetical protein TEOVI_000123700 [Trypanosoma equiperdum]